MTPCQPPIKAPRWPIGWRTIFAFTVESCHSQMGSTFSRTSMASKVASRPEGNVATITVVVRKLPEGVWLATSDDLPGLIVETETRDQAIDLSPQLALELLDDEERAAAGLPRFVFVFP
jgi:hypothetical protein